jgi:WD40 repeat protein
MVKRKYAKLPDMPVIRQPFQDSIGKILFDPTGERMATISVRGAAVLWKGDGAGKAVYLSGANQVVWEAAFSQGGQWLAMVGRGETPKVWNTESFPDPQMILPPPWIHGSVDAIVVESSPTGDELRIRYDHNHFRHFALNGALNEETLEVDSFGLSARETIYRLDPLLNWLSFQPLQPKDPTQSVEHFFPLRGKRDPFLLHGVTKELRRLAVTADGQLILGIAEDGSAFLWNAVEPAAPQPFQRNGLLFSTASFGADGEQLLLGCQDGSIVLCDINDDQKTRLIGKLPNRVAQLEFSPNGDLILAQDEQSIAWMGKISGEKSQAIGRCDAVRFIQNGEAALAVFSDWIVWVNLEGGIRFVRQIDSKSKIILAISPTGHWVLTQSEQSAQIWSTDAAIEPVDLPSIGSPVACATSNPAGTKLYTGHRDGVIFVWTIDLNPSSLKTRLWQATPYCLSVEERRNLLAEDLNVAVKNRLNALRMVDQSHDQKLM